MSLVLTGKGVVWGVAGQDDFYGAAFVKYQKADLKDDFDKKYVHDENGNVIGAIGYNGKRNITIDLIPVAAPTLGIANAITELKLPGKFAKVTLSTFVASGTTFNGVWLYEGGGSIALSNEDVAKLTLPLVQYDTDISATVT